MTSNQVARLESSSEGGQQPVGLLVVDKPKGISSHGVVSRARRILGTKKVGHAGTLDPMATGVLVLGVGRATKLLGYVSGDSKSYEATIRLGIGTVTEDAEGDIEETPGFVLVEPNGDDRAQSGTPVDALGIEPTGSTADIDSAIACFVGQIEQIPSAVSAIKVDGKRAYALVRAGQDVQLKSRSIVVSSFERLREPRVDQFERTPVVDVDVMVDCSSGTYIRALARDLGRKLGTAAHLTALRRTRIGEFGIDRAKTLSELETMVEAGQKPELIPLSKAVADQFTVLVVSDDAARAFANGRPFEDADFVGVESGQIPRKPEGGSQESPILAVATQGDSGNPFALVRFERGKFRSVLHLNV